MTANGTHIACLDRVLHRQRILQHQVKSLGVRRLVVELHPTELESISAYAGGSEADSFQAVFQGAIGTIGKDGRSYAAHSAIGCVLKSQNIFEGIVVTKAGIATAVFKCSLEDAISHAANQLRSYLV